MKKRCIPVMAAGGLGGGAGLNTTQAVTASVEIYDGGVWTAAANLTSPRSNFGLLLVNGKGARSFLCQAVGFISRRLSWMACEQGQPLK